MRVLNKKDMKEFTEEFLLKDQLYNLLESAVLSDSQRAHGPHTSLKKRCDEVRKRMLNKIYGEQI